MFKARLHPKQSIAGLSKDQIENLHQAIVKTVSEVIRQGGRNDETDLYGNRGKYRRIMDKAAAERPCPECGTNVEKTAYLGGACYFCPQCQSAELELEEIGACLKDRRSRPFELVPDAESRGCCGSSMLWFGGAAQLYAHQEERVIDDREEHMGNVL